MGVSNLGHFYARTVYTLILCTSIRHFTLPF